ncbi:MAG: hypothetical protein ACRCX2_30360 [Paraclostridium sp.]
MKKQDLEIIGIVIQVAIALRMLIYMLEKAEPRDYLCFHSFRKFYVNDESDRVVYLECRKCGKRKYKDTWGDRYWTPVDNEWLLGKTLDPKKPKKPIEK